jgi:Flp pilus assembly protein TadG
MKAKLQVMRSRKGFVTVYMVFAMFLLIPMVGLAIDFSVLYAFKGRLQEALDAGAIGAGSMVQRSTDVTDPVQKANILDAVQRFFNANLTPVPWNATKVSYAADVTQDVTTKVRTIHVQATYKIPSLFLRSVGVTNSQVGGQAFAKIRFVNLIIVVDRSGSVNRVGSPATIVTELKTFVANSATSIFVDKRDVVGLVSFGSTWNLDFAPKATFQSATPNIGTAITNIAFDNNSTNTGEGLYQAWYQIAQLNQTGSLNVILLLTDGRPSALTGIFNVVSTSSCTDKTPKKGVINSDVGDGSAWQFPPPLGRNVNGVLQVSPMCTGASCESATIVPLSGGCKYAAARNQVALDIPTIPAKIGPIDNITGTYVPGTTSFDSTATGYYTGGGTNISSPTAVRYAAFNYADNVATAIRKDTIYKPVIYCIGLNFDRAAYPNEEPLDPDFLGHLANDPEYINKVTGLPVFQQGQTAGKYYDVTYSGLKAALADITSQILRLSAN